MWEKRIFILVKAAKRDPIRLMEKQASVQILKRKSSSDGKSRCGKPLTAGLMSEMYFLLDEDFLNMKRRYICK